MSVSFAVIILLIRNIIRPNATFEPVRFVQTEAEAALDPRMSDD